MKKTPAVSGRVMRIETHEQLINFGAWQTDYGFKSPPIQTPERWLL